MSIKNNKRKIFHHRTPMYVKKSPWDLIKDLLPVFTAILAAILTAFLGFSSGSAIAQRKYFSDVQLQNQSYILELRKTAYTNYISGQVKYNESQRLEVTDPAEAVKLRQQFNQEIKTARYQIALYSTKPVVDALVKHFRTSSNFDRPCGGDKEGWQNEARIIQSMRQEVFRNDNGQRVDDKTLITLIFGCTPPLD